MLPLNNHQGKGQQHIATFPNFLLQIMPIFVGVILGHGTIAIVILFIIIHIVENIIVSAICLCPDTFQLHSGDIAS